MTTFDARHTKHDRTERDGGSTAAPVPTHRLGLPQATALVVGSIVGVGIFSLPYALASYGPISLVAMGLARRR